jgi:hypothetical protein
MRATLPRPAGGAGRAKVEIARDGQRITVPQRRPSLMDVRFTGDAWITDPGDGTLSLRLGDYVLASIQGLALDLPSLNHLLEHIWSQRSRRRW